jgi:D-lactate dehydrogenase (cytochrome)
MNAPPAAAPPTAPRRPGIAGLLQALRQRFGERCSTAAAVREQHGRGESVYDAAPPDAVLFCESTEEVAAVLALAAAHAMCRSSPTAWARRWKATCWPCRAG